MEVLTLPLLKKEAKVFSRLLNSQFIPTLYGITDGKKIGTYIEQSFRNYLLEKYIFDEGNSALGIDFPGELLLVDLKVTSIKQPQSSSPFRNARQKVYGLGYHLLVMVYQKTDHQTQKAAQLYIEHVVFIDKARTADYQTTLGIISILENNGGYDSIYSFLEERDLPLDNSGKDLLTVEILNNPPQLGYLTISNALQWRLQYPRAIKYSATIEGLEDILE